MSHCSSKSTCTARRCTAGPATPRSAGTRPRPAPAPPPSGRRPSRRRVRGAGARWRQHQLPDGRVTQRVQVFEAERLRTRGRVFHKQCLSCCRCGHGLTVQTLHCDQVTPSIIYPCSEVRTVPAGGRGLLPRVLPRRPLHLRQPLPGRGQGPPADRGGHSVRALPPRGLRRGEGCCLQVSTLSIMWTIGR